MKVNWASLEHAYGPAADIPSLLAAAAVDPRPGQEPGPWFDLWSSLCHQGDAYSASLVAVPLLIRLAPSQLAQRRYDALLLAACIEKARLEGRAPEIPANFRDQYVAAIADGLTVAESALPCAWNRDAELALRGSIAAFRGDLAAAQAL